MSRVILPMTMMLSAGGPWCQAIGEMLDLRTALILTSVGFVAATGCAAQSSYMDDQDWTRERGDDSAGREVESLFNEEESDADRFNTEPRGVRHDLSFAAGMKPSAQCNCLDLQVAPSSSKTFSWADEVPLIGKQDLLFAMRQRQGHCNGGQTTRRPSIRAVDVVGNNVIVVIEELPFDRPAAMGAIIPRPKPGGQVWIRSHLKRQPFGGTETLSDPGLTRSQRFERRLCRVYQETGARQESR